ncbi:MAG TPA: type III secretion system stator protein SctL [Bryobacteraceae bacterium]|nr:type III secretion system stator protein SctL [Bryobacteraceae bacterium]
MNEKIIKAGTGAPAAPAPAIGDAKILKRDAYAATVEARDILEAAHREARELMERTARERERLLSAAHEEGYQRGLAHWNDAAAAADARRQRLLESQESEIVRLAVRIAGKIIGEELRTHPETIVSIVREALESVRRERSLTIQVHPDLAGQVRSRLDRLEQIVGGGRQIQVIADASVEPGGCIVESELGVIDARLETQLKCLEDALLRAARK